MSGDDLLAAAHRVALARRAAFLIGGERYFATLDRALDGARHSVFVLGWRLDGGIRLTEGGPRLDERLRRLVRDRPGLDVRLLVWDWLFLAEIERRLWPTGLFRARGSDRLSLRLAAASPPGACHHEKLVVIDGALAFCGGIDLAPGRRSNLMHDAVLMVEGDAARLIEDHAIERWRDAGGGDVAPAPEQRGPWPDDGPPDWQDVEVGLARTFATEARRIAEIARLLQGALQAANATIYIESQYFTAPGIAGLLAGRLAEPDGPEVILVVPHRCPGYLERAVMDTARAALLASLRAADRFGRLRIVAPLDGETPVHVHAKLVVVDDRFLMAGSANLARRSLGFDTECSLALAPRDAAGRRAILAARARLLAGHCQSTPAAVEAVARTTGRLAAAIDVLNPPGGRRLVRLDPDPVVPHALDITRPLDPRGPAEEPLHDPEPLVARTAADAPRLQTAVLPAAAAVLLIVAFQDFLAPLGAALPTDAATALAAAALVPCLGGLTFLPLVLIALVFGALVGFLPAILLGGLGALIAALVAHSLGRRLDPRALHGLAGRRFGSLHERFAAEGLPALARARLLPGGPFTTVSLAAGAGGIGLVPYLVLTGGLVLPGYALFALIGVAVREWLSAPDRATLALIGVVLLVLLLGLDRIERRDRAAKAAGRRTVERRALEAVAAAMPAQPPTEDKP